MAERAKHAFGSLENIDQALANGTIDSYDILFVKDANGKPYVGWVDKNGDKVVVSNDAELAELEAQLASKVGAEEIVELETELASKANAEEVAAELATKVSSEEVDAKIETVVTEKVTEKVETVVEQVETIVTEKVETVVNEKVDTQVETIVETKVDAAMDEKVEGAVNTAKQYTDSKIAEIENSYGIVEF